MKNFETRKPVIKQLWIESSGFCNINCVMCGGNPRQKLFTKESGLVGLDFFKSIVDQFIELSGKSLRRIDFRGTGEPLLNSNLPEMVEYGAHRNLLVGVTTNGMLLTEDLSRQLIKNGLTTLTLSTESVNEKIYEAIRRGSKWNIVKDNVTRFSQLIKELKSNCKLQINTVLSEQTINEIAGIIEFGAGIGVDNVSLLNIEVGGIADNVTFYTQEKMHGKSKDELLGLFQRWNKLSQQTGVKLNLPPIQALTDKNCVFNYSGPMIACDGLVFPCCRMQDVKYAYGDLKKQSAREIWEAKEYQQYRQGSHPYCDFCLKYLDRFDNMYWLR